MPRDASIRADRNSQTEAVPSTDDVDKIRDIIFGSQMREYSTRLAQLEKNVGNKIDKLSRDLDKRFEQLTQRLSTEKSERKDAIVTMRGQVREVEKQLKTKLAEADDRVAAEVDEIHGALDEGHKDLSSLIEKAKSELTKDLTAEISKLESQKAGSKDLAQLFAEMARTLKQDSK
ncbi:MAG: hypothetical protein ACR2QQ_16075 [Gammaproteobacteria bacterium]